MGRAEGAVGARKRATEAAGAEARARLIAERVTGRAALLARTETLIPSALHRLDADGYPNGEMLGVERPTRLGGFKKGERAGWWLASYQWLFKGEAVTETHVWLTSDGTLATGVGAGLVHAIDGDSISRGGPAWDDFPFVAIHTALTELAKVGAVTRPVAEVNQASPSVTFRPW